MNNDVMNIIVMGIANVRRESKLHAVVSRDMVGGNIFDIDLFNKSHGKDNIFTDFRLFLL